MALVLKTNPVALDKQINYFQAYLYAKLGFSEWESLHRVYQNPKGNGFIPEAFETNGEYREVFYNDNFSLTSFFIDDPIRPPNNEGVIEATVSMILAANLDDLYPSITDHRPDEKLLNAIQFASESYSGYDTFKLTRIVKTVPLVYSEFLKDQISFDDMGNQFVLRAFYTVQYTPDCA
jgi:hypothetical protein